MAWIKALLGTLLVLATLVVGLCFGLYAVGASALPEDAEPTDYRAPPDLRALYLKVEAGGIEEVPRLNPVSLPGYWLWHLSGEQREPPGSQLRLLGYASRALTLRRSPPPGSTRRHLVGLAATLHVSRQWGLDRMVDTVLAEGGFGRGATGIEQAAQVWYGHPLDDLIAEERLLLIALMKGPAYYDPDCHPERFAQRYRWAAAQAGLADPDVAPALARLRSQPCPAPVRTPSIP